MVLRYRIGEFSELSGVPAKTLRFYDEIGLLRPAGVDPRTQYRYYAPTQLQELASIVALRSLGLSLSEIRNSLTRTASTADRCKLLTHLRATVEHSIRNATESLAWINAALAEINTSQPPVAVIVKRRPAIAVASVRAKVRTYADISQFEQQLLESVPSHCIGKLRGVLWHRCADSGSLEGEPFVALKERLPSRSIYDLKQLPPATLACAYSSTDDASAEQAYDGIRRWMTVRGYQLDGPKRELYLDDMLEIQFPINSA